MLISTGSVGALRIESHSHLGKRNRNNYILPLQHPQQGINLHSTPTGDKEEFQEQQLTLCIASQVFKSIWLLPFHGEVASRI